jgi:hypothetical protein
MDSVHLGQRQQFLPQVFVLRHQRIDLEGFIAARNEPLAAVAATAPAHHGWS